LISGKAIGKDSLSHEIPYYTMKAGEQVSVLDEEGIFTIKKIEKNTAVLVDSYGFENTYLVKHLIPHSLSSEKIYNTHSVPDSKEEDQIQKKVFSPRKREELREVDLHIGNLVDTLTGLQPHQMLQKQINKARAEIQQAKKDKVKKLILIHGKGKGVLKNEIYKLLDSIEGIEYFEADIIKYRFGAVEIRIE
jgi:DNA-nicking Smr family endonuclease